MSISQSNMYTRNKINVALGGEGGGNLRNVGVGVGVYYRQSKASLIYNFPCTITSHYVNQLTQSWGVGGGGGGAPPVAKLGGAGPPPQSYSTDCSTAATLKKMRGKSLHITMHTN